MIANRAHRKTYIREWRKSRGLTLEQVAEYLGITHASLSRIERGLQPYSQPIIEGLADFFVCDPAALLMRNPNDPDGIWSIWDKATKAERQLIIDLANTIVKRGSK
jgi:transcriptional regulator with XRE-family HTH domain